MRREFSKEFKQDAISLVLDQGYTRAEAARSLGIHSALLSRWIREYKEDEGSAFRGRVWRAKNIDHFYEKLRYKIPLNFC
jgi:transposase